MYANDNYLDYIVNDGQHSISDENIKAIRSYEAFRDEQY